MNTLANQLKLLPRHVDSGVRLYRIAIERNFTRGRPKLHMAATCLYVVCRNDKTSHMLIDFADAVHANVFDLGMVFLQFIRLIPLNIPLLDPSLYIKRFASELEFGDMAPKVATSALRLLGRMRRDWMVTGRRPAGLCGAALLIAGRLHGFERTLKEIIYVVRVGEMTIRKRLMEFRQTASSQLTPQEFETIDLEEECDPPAFQKARALQRSRLLRKALEVTGESVVGVESADTPATQESENFSDAEDEEVTEIMLSELESARKAEIWTDMNSEYLKEQKEKEARLEEDREKGILPKPKPKRKRKDEPLPIAETAAEAAIQVLSQKKISKKINYAVLENLFEYDEAQLRAKSNVASPAIA